MAVAGQGIFPHLVFLYQSADTVRLCEYMYMRDMPYRLLSEAVTRTVLSTSRLLGPIPDARHCRPQRYTPGPSFRRSYHINATLI